MENASSPAETTVPMDKHLALTALAVSSFPATVALCGGEIGWPSQAPNTNAAVAGPNAAKHWPVHAATSTSAKGVLSEPTFGAPTSAPTPGDPAAARESHPRMRAPRDPALSDRSSTSRHAPSLKGPSVGSNPRTNSALNTSAPPAIITSARFCSNSRKASWIAASPDPAPHDVVTFGPRKPNARATAPAAKFPTVCGKRSGLTNRDDCERTSPAKSIIPSTPAQALPSATPTRSRSTPSSNKPASLSANCKDNPLTPASRSPRNASGISHSPAATRAKASAAARTGRAFSNVNTSPTAPDPAGVTHPHPVIAASYGLRLSCLLSCSAGSFSTRHRPFNEPRPLALVCCFR